MKIAQPSVELSQSDLLLILAKNVGYTAETNGSIFSPLGNKLKLSKNNNGYLSFMVNVGERSKRRTVLAHRFIMYFFYGEELFKYPLIRHLDDIPTNNTLSNLCVGTYKENRADIPKEKLKYYSKLNAHLLVERSRKLSDMEIKSMRDLRKTTKWSYKDIGTYFKVSAMTAYRAINHQSWSNV